MKLSVFLAGIIALFLVAQSSSGMGEPDYRPDNADWWCLLRDDAAGVRWSARRSERLPASNFTILEVNFEQVGLDEVERRIAPAPTVDRGDASTGRRQKCFKSVSDEGRYKLIFEVGEVEKIFYMLDGGPAWQGMENCVTSSKISADLATKSGIHLGISAPEVKAILGKPYTENSQRLQYHLKSRALLTPKERQEYKSYNGGVAVDYADWWASIVIGFHERRANYIAIANGETL